MLPPQTNSLLLLVSRSFALCIPLLPEKVRTNVANFYLLCRYADTIEDSMLTPEQKKVLFGKFMHAIRTEKQAALLAVRAQLMPGIISAQDKHMVEAFDSVLMEFKSFDLETKRISKKWLFSMVRGMRTYSTKPITDFKDLNRYCYFVAGTVGMYLTELFTYKFELTEQHPLLLARAKDFGLLLQKVNIIRDFSKDYKEGRVFWPLAAFTKQAVTVENVFDAQYYQQRKQVLRDMVASAKTNVQKSMEYIQLLPKDEPGLRIFCAIPLCMAIPTLLKCADNDLIFAPGEKVKIDKLETLSILDAVKKNVTDDAFISSYCAQVAHL